MGYELPNLFKEPIGTTGLLRLRNTTGSEDDEQLLIEQPD